MAVLVRDSETFITRSVLRGRGWTDKTIAQLMPEADQYSVDPHGFGTLCSLFLLERVEEVERSNAFEDALADTLSRAGREVWETYRRLSKRDRTRLKTLTKRWDD